MTKREKRIRQLVREGCTVAGVLVTVVTLRMIASEPTGGRDDVLGMAYDAMAGSALDYMVPVCALQGDGGTENMGQDLAQLLTGMMTRYSPVLAYYSEEENMETCLEDDETTEAIIEATEKNIAAQLIAENQADALKIENLSAGQETGEAAGDAAGQETGEAAGDAAGQETGEAAGDAAGPEAGEAEQDIAGQDGAGQAADETGEDASSQSGQMQAEADTEDVLEAGTEDVLEAVADVPVEPMQNFDYLVSHFFTVDPNTSIGGDQLNAADLLTRDMRMKTDSSQPQILIYHTHSQEGFSDSAEGDPQTSVVALGNDLAALLHDKYGYQVLHNTDTFDIMGGEMDRSAAYDYALDTITRVLEENPSVEVVIDLHRDGVPEEKHLLTEINGQPTAQIMFFNGLSRTVDSGDISYLANPYIEDNLAFSLQLEVQAKRYYPGFVRTVYLKGYRYNLHLRPKCLLLECGAQTNTLQEVKNAIGPFAAILNKVLKGE